jgi:predicted ATPase
MANFLKGLALRGFRGIGPELQVLYPLSRMNLVIGPNNAGKSVILEFLARHLLKDRNQIVDWMRKYDKDEAHIGMNVSQIVFGLGIPFEKFVERINQVNEGDVEIASELVKASVWNDCVWLRPSQDGRSMVFMQRSGEVLKFTPKDDSQHQRRVSRLWSDLSSQQGGGYQQHWLPESLGLMAQLILPSLPTAVTLIPAIRQIGAHGEEFADCSGKGLIDRLAELQNPPHDEQDKRKMFLSINRFLQIVTKTEDAQIEIPYDRRHVLVSMRGRILPLAYLGTGIHEVIMLATFCTLASDQVVCIEEPEIHLHPVLQRKLIAYLLANTSNQYFIATHSASFLDAAEANVFHVDNSDGSTRIRLATSDNEKFQICRDLGLRASDILQANSVIWVEGPSDRVYIRSWIGELAPDLIEGVHYSIMFYGGRLLSHLSADDSEIDDFISLRRMNRRSYIIIDSDRSEDAAEINATKRRVLDSFTSTFSWLTAGREIENYLQETSLTSALTMLYGSKFSGLPANDMYNHAFKFINDTGDVVSADKVKLAHAVTALPINLDKLDLRERAEKLVTFIRESNS